MMSTPAHLWLTDENDAPIIGECLIPARLGSIEMRTLTHSITIPVDASIGKLTGTRVHTPIVFQKEFDRTTPLLLRALCQGRVLKSAIIRTYTRHTSSCRCVGCIRSPQSLTDVSSWGLAHLPPSCNSNYLE